MQRQLKKALLAVPAASMSLAAQAQPMTERSDVWYYGWGWGHMIFGSVMMLLFWGGIIIVIVLAVRWISGGSSQGTALPPSRNRALEILEERFARGEIDKEEFEERKRLLRD
jgi:putative membrane protein